MAYYQALGTGPVSFVDSNQNQQQIPLSAIYFDAGAPNATNWPGYSANAAVLQALLASMVAQGYLAPGVQTTPTIALTIEATDAGSAGNAITVTFSNVVTTPAPGTFDVAVNAKQVYQGLTEATIGAALGTSPATANGLVYLQVMSTGTPAAFAGALGGAPKYEYVVPDAHGNGSGAFTLAAASQTADATAIQLALTLDPAPAQTFTLTASWSKSATALTVNALTTPATNPFAMVVTFSGPTDGPLPAEGTLTLSGGGPAASTAATPATANVLSL